MLKPQLTTSVLPQETMLKPQLTTSVVSLKRCRKSCLLHRCWRSHRCENHRLLCRALEDSIVEIIVVQQRSILDRCWKFLFSTTLHSKTVMHRCWIPNSTDVKNVLSSSVTNRGRNWSKELICWQRKFGKLCQVSNSERNWSRELCLRTKKVWWALSSFQ